MTSDLRPVERRLAAVVRDRIQDEAVIVLHGPRSVGKSTLLQELATEFSSRVVDLDDLAVRDAVREDPGLYAAGPAPILGPLAYAAEDRLHVCPLDVLWT